jgi:hypothetical protein
MAYGERAVVVEFLSRMVREGTIAGFRTLHFGKAETGEDPTVIVTVGCGPGAAEMRALRQKISDDLTVLVGEVVVIVQQDQSEK